MRCFKIGIRNQGGAFCGVPLSQPEKGTNSEKHDTSIDPDGMGDLTGTAHFSAAHDDTATTSKNQRLIRNLPAASAINPLALRTSADTMMPHPLCATYIHKRCANESSWAVDSIMMIPQPRTITRYEDQHQQQHPD